MINFYVSSNVTNIATVMGGDSAPPRVQSPPGFLGASQWTQAGNHQIASFDSRSNATQASFPTHRQMVEQIKKKQSEAWVGPPWSKSVFSDPGNKAAWEDAARAGRAGTSGDETSLAGSLVQMAKSGVELTLSIVLPNLPGAMADAHVCGLDGGACTTPEQQFLAACAKAGMTLEQTQEILDVWQEHHIPLHPDTVPRFTSADVVGKLKSVGADNAPFVSKFTAQLTVEGKPVKHFIKCYPAGDGQQTNQGVASGIPLRYPVPQLRAVVASKVDKYLGFGLAPDISLGYFDGKPCVVSKWVKGQSFAQAIGGPSDKFNREMRQGDRPTDDIRLVLLALITANVDLHRGQVFLAEVEGVARLQIFDFDQTGGERCRSIKDFQTMAGVNAMSKLPNKAMLQPIASEFLLRADPAKIRGLAEGLWTKAECEALERRVRSVVKHVRKEMDS